MGLFSNLTTNGLEKAKDTLGGLRLVDSDIYPMTIKVAYAGSYESGAQYIAVVGQLEDGSEYKENLLITTKEGNNFFMGGKNKDKKTPLQSFTIMDDICVIASDKPLCEQDTEEKVVNVFDKDAKKELPKSVQVLTALTDQVVAVAIIRQLVDKTEKNAQTGTYDPTGETTEENTIQKVFHPTLKLTVVEATEGKEAAFWDAWLTKNKGKVPDKSKGVQGKAGAPGAGAPAGSAPGQPAAGARPSLFAKP